MPKQSRSKMKSIEEKATWDPSTRRWKCKGAGCSTEVGPESHRVVFMHHHWNTMHSGKTFNCEYCERSFKTGSNMRRHVKPLHTVPPPSVSNMEQCSSCLWAWLPVSEHWKFCPMPNGRYGTPRAGWEWNDHLRRCVRIEREAESWLNTAENRRSESPKQDEENVDRSSLPAPTQPQTEQQVDVSHWPILRYLSPTFDSPRPLHRHLAQSATFQPFHNFETSESTEHFDCSVLEPHPARHFHPVETARTFDSQNHSTNTSYALPLEYRPHQAFPGSPRPQYSNEYVDKYYPISPLTAQTRHRDHHSNTHLPIDPEFYTEPYLLNHTLPPSALQSLPSHIHVPNAPYYQTPNLSYSPQFPPRPIHHSHNPSFFPFQRPIHHESTTKANYLRSHGDSIPIDPRLTGDEPHNLEDSQSRYSLGRGRIPLTYRQALRYNDLVQHLSCS